MRLAPMKAIQQLQLEVLTKFNVTQLQPSDCKDLSVLVRDCTGKIVSETTIKRFFGFAAQTFNFSVYTLNALAEYAGFQNWEFFLEHYRLQQSPQKEFHPKWKEIKSKTGKISFYTTETIKNNCGMDFTRTADRVAAISATTGVGHLRLRYPGRFGQWKIRNPGPSGRVLLAP
jgi:hypothetical protein